MEGRAVDTLGPFLEHRAQNHQEGTQCKIPEILPRTLVATAILSPEDSNRLRTVLPKR